MELKEAEIRINGIDFQVVIHYIEEEFVTGYEDYYTAFVPQEIELTSFEEYLKATAGDGSIDDYILARNALDSTEVFEAAYEILNK